MEDHLRMMRLQITDDQVWMWRREETDPVNNEYEMT